jgi:hypothetical protein
MNEPREPVRPQEWDEVQRAYREAPTPAPSAPLDARVRAAVEAHLAASAARPRAAQVIPFRRWRRLAVPLAAAATVVMAMGVVWLGHTSTTGNSALVASAPVAEQEQLAVEPAAAADAAKMAASPRMELVQEQTQRKPVSQLPASSALPAVPRRDAPPPPAAPPAIMVAPMAMGDMLAAPMPAPVQSTDLRLAGSAPARELARDAAEPAAAKAAPVARSVAAATANGVLAEATSQVSPASLEQVRQLLRVGQNEAARALFKHWREAHAAEPVPEDLKALAGETAR